MKINEICKSKTQCVVQMGPKRGFGAGKVDPKLADAADKRQDAQDEEVYNYESGLTDKQWDTWDRARMQAYNAGGISPYKAHLAAKQQMAAKQVARTAVGN